MKWLSFIGLEGGENHRVVGRLTVGILERDYSLDRLDRARLRWLGAVSLLQRSKERELVRLWVPARCRLSPSGRREREKPKGLITRRGY